MYKHYFGFNEPPFSIAPDPRYLYMSEMHQEALAHLTYGATSEGCIILLTGKVGTGKTTICRCFLEQLSRETNIAVIINPKLSGDELLAAICDEFQITGIGSNPTTKDYIDSLNGYLLRTHAAGQQAVLVIDEAQNLDLDVLEMLRLLTNLETEKQKLLKIFLLGQSELATILSRPDLAQISQRITSRYHLKGLHRQDVEAYINHRITIAGGGRARLFNNASLKRIYELSHGIPRLINSLCDRALLGAYSEGKNKIDLKIIKKAAREVFGETVPKEKSFKPGKLVSMAGLLLVILLFGIWLGSSPDLFESKTAKTVPVHNPGVKETSQQPELAIVPDPAPLLPTLLEEAVPPQENNQQEKTRIVIEPIEIRLHYVLYP